MIRKHQCIIQPIWTYSCKHTCVAGFSCAWMRLLGGFFRLCGDVRGWECNLGFSIYSTGMGSSDLITRFCVTYLAWLIGGLLISAQFELGNGPAGLELPILFSMFEIRNRAEKAAHQDVQDCMLRSMASKRSMLGAWACFSLSVKRLYRLKDFSSSQMNPKRSSSKRTNRPGVRSGLVKPWPAIRPVP